MDHSTGQTDWTGSALGSPTRPGSPRVLGVPITVWLLALALFFLARMFLALADGGADAGDGAGAAGATGATGAAALEDDRGRTLDDAIPSGDPDGSRFVHRGFAGEWEGSVLGVLELEARRPDELDGRCLAVIGTLEPVVLAGPVSTVFSAPSISLLLGDELVAPGVNDCEIGALEELGIGWYLDVEVTRGTTYAFHTEFVVDADRVEELRAIVLEGGSSPLYFEPLRLGPDDLAELTAPGGRLAFERLVGPPPDVELAPLGVRAADSPLDGVVLGVLETGPGRWSSREGRCIVVLGVLEPSVVDAPPSVPPIGLVAGGRLVRSRFGTCDTDAIQAAGYVWWLDDSVGGGDRAPFFVEFVVPSWLPLPPQAIVVGQPGMAPVAHAVDVLPGVPVP